MTDQTDFTLIEGEDTSALEAEELLDAEQEDETEGEEEVDREEWASDPVVETPPAVAAPTAQLPNVPARVTVPPPAKPVESFVTADPYDLTECQVTFAVSLLPSDQEDGSRTATVGIRNHLDAPIIRVVANFTPDKLSEIFQELWTELETQMPFRKMEAAKKPKQMINGTMPAVVKTSAPAAKYSTSTNQLARPGSNHPSPTPPPSAAAENNQLDLFGMFSLGEK